MPGFDMPHFRTNRTYAPYKVSDDRKKSILSAYPKLKAGMNEQQVFDLLGKPDVAEEGWAKEGPFCRAISWQYWVELTHDSANENDSMIELFFSKDGLVQWVVPHPGLGLKEKGTYLRQ